MLSNKLVGPLVDSLVTDPVGKLNQVELLDLGPAEDLCSNGVGDRANEHRFRMVVAYPVAILIEHVHPTIDVLIQVLHMLALWVLLEASSAGDLN